MTTMTTKANRFKKGSGCYECRRCHKKTRSTGRGDNEYALLCERCFDISGEENAVQDGEMTREEFKERWGQEPEI